MRFYVASGLENHAIVAKLVKLIQDEGHVVTYDWSKHGAVQKEGEVAEDIRERLATTATSEMQGVLSAQILIALMPGGKGTHVEIGAALANGCTILLVMRPEDKQGRACCFHYHPHVKQLVTRELEMSLGYILQWSIECYRDNTVVDLIDFTDGPF